MLSKKIEIPLILGGYRSAITASADVKASGRQDTEPNVEDDVDSRL